MKKLMVRLIIVLVMPVITHSISSAYAYAGDAAAYIISPADGAQVTNPVLVQFGLRGMGVAPAGMDRPNTGHHHLLIDLLVVPAMNESIPADANHRHFGGGQTEVSLELPSGQHTLQLLLGDKAHVPHNPPLLSRQITITVH